MHSELTEIPGSRGHSLAASLDLPNCKPDAWAIFAHCFTCSRNSNAARAIGEALTSHGIAVMRLDFTGIGRSGGELGDDGISGDIQDIIDAANWLADHHDAPALLIGHSLGGAAVLRAAMQLDSVRAVATIGAPADPQHVLDLIPDKDQIEQQGQAQVDIAGRPFTITRQFLDDMRNHPVDQLADLRRPLLVMHAPFDNIVGIDNAQDIFVAAKHPKSFVSLDDADHLLTDITDAHYAAAVIASWGQRYLDNERSDHGHDHGVVAQTDPDGFRTEICTGDHRIIADEPTDVGGTNLGPTPYELLSSALAACTTMTMRMYANRKDWDTTGVYVQVSHEKKHDPDQDGKKIDTFTRTLVFSDTSLDSDQKQRLREIADKCPVHKTLSGGAKIETDVVD